MDCRELFGRRRIRSVSPKTTHVDSSKDCVFRLLLRSSRTQVDHDSGVSRRHWRDVFRFSSLTQLFRFPSSSPLLSSVVCVPYLISFAVVFGGSINVCFSLIEPTTNDTPRTLYCVGVETVKKPFQIMRYWECLRNIFTPKQRPWSFRRFKETWLRIIVGTTFKWLRYPTGTLVGPVLRPS